MRQSELFNRVRREAPTDEVAKNAQLLIRAGFVEKEMAGVYSYLPLGRRVLENLENLIRKEMLTLDAQEVLLPALQPMANWQLTGRWQRMTDLYKLKDGSGREFALGPTHEEIITPLVARYISSYQDLPNLPAGHPLGLFQFQTKFRMEARAKSGLLRGREFLMKDLYSFHQTEDDLQRYYELVKLAYRRIFEQVELSSLTYLTRASGGTFSDFSHEFQVLTSAGEDNIHLCENCRLAINDELSEAEWVCPGCGRKDLRAERAIEVGNIFQLGTTFSKAFKLTYRNQSGEDQPVIMGCYGLGVSRLLGTLAEVLADERGLIWPKVVAPYTIHLLNLGGEAEAGVSALTEMVYGNLLKVGYEVLWDDRPVSAGEKLAGADLFGFPYRVVVSPKLLAGNNVEVKERTGTEAILVPADKLCAYLG